MSAAVPSRGWCVEITGDKSDLEEWGYDLKSPFDPWLERFPLHGREIVALRSAAFQDADSADQVQAIGRLLVEQLTGAFLISSGYRSKVNLGASLFVDEAQQIHASHFLHAETAHFRIRMGRPTLTVYDASGKVAPPPPPKPSTAQLWASAATTAERIGELLLHSGRADNWFDLFKAFEVARKLAGGEPRLAKLANQSTKQVDQLRRSANHYRHANLEKPPPKLLSLDEAKEQLRSLVSAVLADVAGADLRPSDKSAQ